MKKEVKNFFVRHMAAFLIGALIFITFAITKGMIDSIKENMENFSLITPLATDTSDDIAAALMGQEYTVREFEGRIGVFLPDETQPFRVEQTYVAYLPEADKDALERGITVYGWRALEKLLDDLYS